MSKTVLFDFDGVLSQPEELFSVIYARAGGFDIAPLTNFFETEWSEFVTGKRDLKEHIKNHPELWKWTGSPEALLRFWFECQDDKNESMFQLINRIRKQATLCYVATEQDTYRTQYIRNVTLKDDVDGLFSTAEIGYKKNDARFYGHIIDVLSVRPSQLIFFDDSQSKVDTAKSAGIDAHLFESADRVARILKMD